jgi:hypothetical protein
MGQNMNSRKNTRKYLEDESMKHIDQKSHNGISIEDQLELIRLQKDPDRLNALLQKSKQQAREIEWVKKHAYDLDIIQLYRL